MKKTQLIAILLLSASLAACNNPNVPTAPAQFENPVQQAPQPQAQNGFDAGDAALGAVAGAAAGYMMGKGSSSNNRPVYVDQRPVYVNNGGYNNGYGRRNTTTITKTTTYKKGFGGTVTKTVRTTKRRR